MRFLIVWQRGGRTGARVWTGASTWDVYLKWCRAQRRPWQRVRVTPIP